MFTLSRLLGRPVNNDRLQWLLKRTGEQRSAMFNEAWIGLALLLLFVGLLVRQGALPILSSLLFTVVGVSWLWNRLALSQVEYERHLSVGRAFTGEIVELTVSVINRKFLPIAWLHLDDRVPIKLPFLDAQIASTDQPKLGALSHLTATRWFERVNWHYRVEARYRGFYFLGPVRMRSGDLFGLFSSVLTLAPLTRLIVYPRLIPLQELGFPASTRSASAAYSSTSSKTRRARWAFATTIPKTRSAASIGRRPPAAARCRSACSSHRSSRTSPCSSTWRRSKSIGTAPTPRCSSA